MHLTAAQGWLELGNHEEAFEQLKEGLRRHDEEELVWYNLACYACVLGKKFEARKKLEKAIDMGGYTVKMRALDDPDLEELWRSGEKK